MIISASRRTDIPAFYADWFLRRVRDGSCTVPNPFRPSQATKVSLRPEDVDAVVFWTRHPRPLFPYLPELDRLGFRYYFQFTLLDYPRQLEPRGPSFTAALRAFRELADGIGPERVVWRYDPIVISRETGVEFHLRAFEKIARLLCGHTRRSVISLLDRYRKVERRLRALPVEVEPESMELPDLEILISSLAAIAAQNGMEIQSCAEEIDLESCGVRHGKCVDDGLIREALGVTVPSRKDPAQRPACGCVTSRDIGMYDSCPFGCQYCYATNSFERAAENYRRHNPARSSLVPLEGDAPSSPLQSG